MLTEMRCVCRAMWHGCILNLKSSLVITLYFHTYTITCFNETFAAQSENYYGNDLYILWIRGEWQWRYGAVPLSDWSMRRACKCVGWKFGRKFDLNVNICLFVLADSFGAHDSIDWIACFASQLMGSIFTKIVRTRQLIIVVMGLSQRGGTRSERQKSVR